MRLGAFRIHIDAFPYLFKPGPHPPYFMQQGMPEDGRVVQVDFQMVPRPEDPEGPLVPVVVVTVESEAFEDIPVETMALDARVEVPTYPFVFMVRNEDLETPPDSLVVASAEEGISHAPPAIWVPGMPPEPVDQLGKDRW